MDGYTDRATTEVVSVVTVDRAEYGTAAVGLSVSADRGAHTVELCARVSREDLPKLVMDLYALVADDMRPTLLDSLRDQG